MKENIRLVADEAGSWGIEKNLYIPKSEGRHSLLSAEDIFLFDKSCYRALRNINRSGNNTLATGAKYYTVSVREKFHFIFPHFTSRLSDVCLKQSQITAFCRTHMKWICKSRCETIFLTEEKGEYGVVMVKPFKLPGLESLEVREHEKRLLLKYFSIGELHLLGIYSENSQRIVTPLR